jgi:hypothetical protein
LLWRSDIVMNSMNAISQKSTVNRMRTRIYMLRILCIARIYMYMFPHRKQISISSRNLPILYCFGW